jgi:hypothetical protein
MPFWSFQAVNWVPAEFSNTAARSPLLRVEYDVTYKLAQDHMEKVLVGDAELDAAVNSDMASNAGTMSLLILDMSSSLCICVVAVACNKTRFQKSIMNLWCLHGADLQAG